jgi:hypothetical protein
MEILEIKTRKKTQHKYICLKCDFKCCSKYDYNIHIMRPKHINMVIGTEMEIKKSEKSQNQFVCDICYKGFMTKSGLWKHNKKCEKISINKTENQETDTFTPNMFMEMMKQNNELTKQIIELSSKPMTTNNTTNNNTTNNNFNLQFFLNETCKDALNISDFIDQLQVGTKDLEETGRIGYAAGISKIFINGLKQLSVNQRPVHCSDAKRETIYIKDGGQWEKDNDENVKLTNAIRDVAHKNIEQIQVWTELHPEYTDLKSKYNDRYMKLIGEAMSGSTNEETYRNYKKIARNIMRETIIPK